MTEDDTFELPYRKSKVREEIEEALKRQGISIEKRISILNLDTSEQHYFDSYQEALEFMKGKKGRWYMTTPGIRYDREKVEKPKP
jgi:hypothetical protein